MACTPYWFMDLGHALSVQVLRACIMHVEVNLAVLIWALSKDQDLLHASEAEAQSVHAMQSSH